MYKLGFINERGKEVELKYTNEYKFRMHLNSLKHSKKCRLLYYFKSD